MNLDKMNHGRSTNHDVLQPADENVAERSLSAVSRTDLNESLELEEEEGDNVGFFILTLKPQKIYKFELTFTPQNTKPYEFRFPLNLGNNTEFNSEL